MNKKFKKFRRQTITDDITFPLDYIMTMPKHLKNPLLSEPVQIRAWKLENILKNVVVRRLTEIRKVKNKPTMKEMIDAFLYKRNSKDERGVIRIKDQAIRLYE